MKLRRPSVSLIMTWPALLLLIGFLIDPVTGAIAGLHLRTEMIRGRVKNRIEAGVRESDLVVLSFSAGEALAELRWEHPDEFEYRGRMYDVVRKETAGGRISFWCRFDDEETDVRKKYMDLVHRTFRSGTGDENSFSFVSPEQGSSVWVFPAVWVLSVREAVFPGPDLSDILHLSVRTRPPSPPPRPV
jgi:hypothetical protein